MMPSGTYGWPEQESKGSCFCQRRRSFITVRHDWDAVVDIVIVGIIIVGIVIIGIVILRPNEPQAQTKAFISTHQGVFRRGLLGLLFLGERIQRQG